MYIVINFSKNINKSHACCKNLNLKGINKIVRIQYYCKNRKCIFIKLQ